MHIENYEEFGPIDDEDFEDELNNVFDGEDVDDRELLVLSALVFSSEITDRCISFLDADMFGESSGKAFQLIKKFHAANGVPPDLHEVKIESGLDLFELNGYPRAQESILEHLTSKIEEFARRAILENDLLKSIDDFDDYQKARSIIQNSFDRMDEAVASRPEAANIADPEYFESLLVWNEENTHDSTGFDMLDEVISVTRPSVNMISASTGVGKSWFLLNQAVLYARQGRNVVLFSLELSQEEANSRLLQIVTGRSMEQIKDDPDGTYQMVKSSFRKMGKIVIECLPMGRSTCADLEGRIKQIGRHQEIEIDYVIIDHLDHLVPAAGYRDGDIHDRDKKATAELFNLAQKRNAIVWTASQQVKSAANEKPARADSLSGGADKANISANVIVLKKTETKHTHQVLVGTVVKGRGGGTDMRVPFKFSTGSGRISTPESLRPLFDEMNTPDDPDGKASKPKKKRSEGDAVRGAIVGKAGRRLTRISDTEKEQADAVN